MHAIDFLRNPAKVPLKPVYAVSGDDAFLRKETLEAIIEDEVGHIDWIQAELEKYAGGPDGEKVKHAIAASEAASKTVSEKFYENPLIQRYLELAT